MRYAEPWYEYCYSNYHMKKEDVNRIFDFLKPEIKKIIFAYWRMGTICCKRPTKKVYQNALKDFLEVAGLLCLKNYDSKDYTWIKAMSQLVVDLFHIDFSYERWRTYINKYDALYIEECINTILNEKERYIITKRYGFEDGKRCTMKEIKCDKLNHSTQWISECLGKARGKILFAYLKESIPNMF